MASAQVYPPMAGPPDQMAGKPDQMAGKPDQGYWLPADSAIGGACPPPSGGVDYWIPPDSEVGLPILGPPDGDFTLMEEGGPTVVFIYPDGQGADWPALCPLSKPGQGGVVLRAEGSPPGGTYHWPCDTNVHGPEVVYRSTDTNLATCLTHTETVTYVVVEETSLMSGYIRVFDADLTLAGGSADPQCNVEADTGFFMAKGTRKQLTLRLQPADPDDVMPSSFDEGLHPRGLLPPYQVGVSASGGYCVDFYAVQQGGSPLTSDGLLWGWTEVAFEVFEETPTTPGQIYVQAETAGTCTIGLGLQFRCPQECGDWLGESSAGDQVKVTVLDLKLREVTFSADPDSPVNYFSVGQDTNALAYPVPHWLDANGDGDADDPAQGDQQSPVCYIRNTKMAATVKVALGSPQYFDGVVKIRGDGPGNLNFPETVATVASGEATITEVKCANAFPDCVTCYVSPDTALAISWEISRDGGASWIEIPPQSKNDAFIILDQPQAPQALPWRSVLEKATYWADAETTVAGAVAELAAELYDSGLSYDGGQSYYQPDQWPSYTKFTFHLTQLLNDWNEVDCQDVSMFLTCLASSTGCTLTDTRRVQGPFTTKSIRPIGAGWTVTGWNFHHIGWKGNVYDACEKLKQSAPYLPINVDIATPYKVDLYDVGTWSPQTPFTLGSTDPYRGCPSDVD